MERLVRYTVFCKLIILGVAMGPDLRIFPTSPGSRRVPHHLRVHFTGSHSFRKALLSKPA